ncbi:hypothetical protein B566_EDAN002939 [Ephemera danica]|nr:hypothetical protein B566_EDAN002939 [Ephemera danica]
MATIWRLQYRASAHAKGGRGGPHDRCLPARVCTALRHKLASAALPTHLQAKQVLSQLGMAAFRASSCCRRAQARPRAQGVRKARVGVGVCVPPSPSWTSSPPARPTRPSTSWTSAALQPSTTSRPLPACCICTSRSSPLPVHQLPAAPRLWAAPAPRCTRPGHLAFLLTGELLLQHAIVGTVSGNVSLPPSSSLSRPLIQVLHLLMILRKMMGENDMIWSPTDVLFLLLILTFLHVLKLNPK